MTMTATRQGGKGASPVTPPARRASGSNRWLFVLPASLFLGAFALIPLIQLVRMSVSSVTAGTLNGQWPFVGLSNFAAGWSSGATQAALIRTLLFVIVVTLLGMGLGLAAAIVLRDRGWWGSAVLALMVFCWALPPVVNGSVWKFLFADEGLLNSVVQGMGLSSGPLPFLYDQNWALMCVAFVNSWAVIPFNALVFRSALLEINPELFEASALDGASRAQQIRHIMIPAAWTTGLVLLVLTIVYGFRSFDFIYVMTAGGPGTATNTLPYLGYLQAFHSYDYGLGASTSVLAMALVVVLALAYARQSRKEQS